MSKAAATPVVAIALHRRPIGRRCGGCGRLNGGDHAQLIIELEERPVEQGPLTGQKRPLKPKDIWAIRVRLQLQHRRRDLALFNLAIDSKLRAATSCGYRSTTFASVAKCGTAPLLSRRRRIGRSSSRSPSRPEHRSEIGFPASRRDGDSTSSPAASRRSRIYRRGSMRESFMLGSPVLGSTEPPTGRIRCGGRRRRRSIRRRGT